MKIATVSYQNGMPSSGSAENHHDACLCAMSLLGRISSATATIEQPYLDSNAIDTLENFKPLLYECFRGGLDIKDIKSYSRCKGEFVLFNFSDKTGVVGHLGFDEPNGCLQLNLLHRGTVNQNDLGSFQRAGEKLEQILRN